MFTDIHTHILPKVDDGCSSLQESLELIKSEIENDVENIILTPHFNCEGNNSLNKKAYLEKLKKLKSYVKKNNISINIFPGMEVRASYKVFDILNKKDFLLTLLDKKEYILIEAPFTHLPTNFSEMLFKIKLLGLVPILAHPERNDEIRSNLGYLKKLRDEELLVQVNNSSLTNKKNKSSYRTAVRMLKLDMVDLIASDCHYMKGRFSNFKKAYSILMHIVGREKASRIAIENPNKILLGEDI